MAAIFSSLLLGACSYSSQTDTTRFIAVEEEIEVNIMKDLMEEDQYHLTVRTLQSDLCEESTLITHYKESDQTVLLNIDGLEIPSDCSNFDTQIISIEDFELSNDQKTVEITLAQNLVNKIFINKTEDKLHFVHNNLRGIVFEQDELLPIKTGYLWGGIYSNSVKDAKHFNDFIELIRNSVAHNKLDVGNYGHFEIGESTKAFDPYRFAALEQAFALDIKEEVPILDTVIPELILEFKMNHPSIDVVFVSGNGIVY